MVDRHPRSVTDHRRALEETGRHRPWSSTRRGC